MVRIKEIKEEITIPDNVQITVADEMVTVKSEKGIVSRQIVHPKIKINVKNNIVEINCTDSPKKKEKSTRWNVHRPHK